MADIRWHKLPTSLIELNINTTLRCGQSFRWKKSDDDVWSCTLHGRLLSLRQDATHLHWKAVFPPKDMSNMLKTTIPYYAGTSDADTLALIRHYLNLEPNLGQLYEQWASADSNFRKKAPKFTGVRILKQDAWEALVGFICSSNNNIIRISQMVDKLCKNYGPPIATIDDVTYHDFPQPKSLTGPDTERELREMGFGYRAKYLYRTACMVEEKGLSWLNALRNPESPVIGDKPSPAGPLVEGGREGYREAHEQLLTLQGVGPKVADCVCLFGLGWGESVPVDTHVWQIAQRDYKFGKGKHSSLTKATYDAVGNKFRSLWGQEAGWAHSVLFTADLKAFSEQLVAKVEEETTTLVKQEGDDAVKIEEVTTTTVSLKREIKVEEDDDEKENLIIPEPTVGRRAKRARKT